MVVPRLQLEEYFPSNVERAEKLCKANYDWFWISTGLDKEETFFVLTG